MDGADADQGCDAKGVFFIRGGRTHSQKGKCVSVRDYLWGCSNNPAAACGFYGLRTVTARMPRLVARSESAVTSSWVTGISGDGLSHSSV